MRSFVGLVANQNSGCQRGDDGQDDACPGKAAPHAPPSRSVSAASSLDAPMTQPRAYNPNLRLRAPNVRSRNAFRRIKPAASR